MPIFSELLVHQSQEVEFWFQLEVNLSDPLNHCMRLNQELHFSHTQRWESEN